MERAKQLQPLSREHHLGLVIATHAKRCANDVEDIAKHWMALTEYINDNMSNHFKVEDDLLLVMLARYKDSYPKVAKVLDIIASQHKKLYKIIHLPSLSANQIRELGKTLYEHIRFEERELFPLAQELLSKQELDAIYEASSDNVKHK
ncbi:hypothetical protein [Psychrobacter lutiphocae]|uniref:hypothetical protein n=1 Tax=Psychrobacter lutiphocae TaxID=540500 RepID=UPI00036ADC9B|nr:hypothetical protein [Psychrobacter lutiphocae]